MGAKSIIEEVQQEKVIDNLSSQIAEGQNVDSSKLAALKAKSQAKQMEKSVVKDSKKERSIQFGIIGSGQAGSRLAETFYKLGYDAVACNTASQDLRFIDIPDSNKLLLQYGSGGAAKETDIGRMAAETHRDEIVELVNDHLSNSQVNLLCLSLGGGSGAGSTDTIVDVLFETGKPVCVICILPMTSEDAATKQNSLETLSKLTKLTQSKKVSNLIIIDNAKLESIYHNVNQLDFYQVANKAIVETIDVFNTMSSLPSSVKSLDPMEMSKMFLDGGGCSIFGELVVSDFTDDTAIASAVINNLDSNLLASGFDLNKARYVGVLFVASKQVWERIPSSSVNYALSMVNDRASSPQGIFKGIYQVDSNEQVIKVYSFFSGLSLPEDRIAQLKNEVKELNQSNKTKDEVRNLSLKLDTGLEENVSAAQAIKNKIAAKSSSFGKFVNNVVDKRK